MSFTMKFLGKAKFIVSQVQEIRSSYYFSSRIRFRLRSVETRAAIFAAKSGESESTGHCSIFYALA